MKQFLEKVRTAQWQSLPKQIIATTGVVLLGFALGVLQKWMDGSSDNLFPVWIQQLDIGNYFNSSSGKMLRIFSTVLRASLWSEPLAVTPTTTLPFCTMPGK